MQRSQPWSLTGHFTFTACLAFSVTALYAIAAYLM
jgi:hypothetical protein